MMMTNKNINHVNLNQFPQVLDLINSLDLSTFAIPSYVPPQDGLWHNLDLLNEVGLPIVSDGLPSSVYVVDFETINDTKTLVMGTAFDYLNRQLWMMISEPGTNKLCKTIGKSIFIAHSACFENSLFRDAYNLQTNIRFFCTKSIAALKYHSCQVNLYRQSPYLPMFRESNDLSLAELSLKLCGRLMDKSAVEVFIKAKDETWRDSKFEIHKDCLPQLTKIVEKLNKTVKVKTPKIKTTKKSRKLPNQATLDFLDKQETLDSQENLTPQKVVLLEEFVREMFPTGQASDNPDLLTSHKSKNCKYVWHITPTIQELMTYNCTDVSATAGVFQSLWGWYKDYPLSFMAGTFQRSIPFLPLSEDWDYQVGLIEAEFADRLKKLVRLVYQVEQDYLQMFTNQNGEIHGNDWDYLDWERWGKTASPEKIGNIRWLRTTGLSSKQLMRISRLYWKGRPLMVIGEDRTTKDGGTVIKKDGSASQMLRWITVNPIISEITGKVDWLTSVKLKENPIPFDNPNNTGSDLCDTISVFSKAFIPHWDNGSLTSESPVAREICEIYSTISFWQSFRDRIINKAPIYNTGDYLGLALRPHVIGTVTGRAVDPIGLVWSKSDKNKVGSEISGHVCAPKGYQIISADFDSLQANITAFYAAIEVARRQGKANEPINVLNNEFSISVLTGNKENQTTLAYLIAKQTGLWAPEMSKEDKAAGYSLAKNISYAMLFGAGLGKLILMCGDEAQATKILQYFKGTINKSTKRLEGGIASDYFNYAKDLAEGLVQGENGKFWKLSDEMYSTFLKRPLPRIMCVSNRGRDLSTTAQNSVTQSVDPEFLNYQVDFIIRECDKRQIPLRYMTTVHDDVKFLIKDEDSEEVSQIFQDGHTSLYKLFCQNLNISPDSLPENVWRYSSVDVNPRYTKSVGDLGKTLSNLEGYDYETSASFEDVQDEGVYFPDDYLSSATMKKFYKQQIKEELFKADI